MALIREANAITIVPWSPEHASWLRHAIGQFFEAGLARGGELLNTPRNVETYLNLGLLGASQGDPCLLALVSGTPVAYVLWIGAPSNVLDAKWKSVNAIGSYTEPAHRNRTIATLLRDTAIARCKERGYERARGPVAIMNTRGVKEFCEVYGAWPLSVNFDLELAESVQLL